jgi:hypothetical protein
MSLLLRTDHCEIELDDAGTVTRLTSVPSGREMLAGGLSPLMQLVSGDVVTPPSSASLDGAGGLTLAFGGTDTTVTVSVHEHGTHVGFEVTGMSGAAPDGVQWGPIQVGVGETVGEIVGVTRDAEIAVGIQAASIQTAGGHAGGGVGDALHAAAETEDGAALQAYTLGADGGVLGSKVALFVCAAGDALATIGEIEIAEGLPHPMLDGEWTKVSRTSRESYLIANFGEDSLDDLLAATKQAGFRYLYHGHPFKTWGHFDLLEGDFPDGDASLKRCVDRAGAEDVRIGVHTLTNFITTNDAYVTPAPDAGLMRVGTARLAGPVDAATRDVVVDDPVPFREKGDLSAVAIGGEIVQYRAVSDAAPWTLLGCRRGAFDTTAAAHDDGEEVGKLADHSYRVFFPDLDLQDELVDRLVELFETCGLRQISFDGLEGCGYTGHGMYAHHLFVERFYDGCSAEVLNDASRLLHYLWHVHTRMNWGEPWGKPTRDGMSEYRFRNQAYFERNLFPRMLGWFQLRLAGGDVEATSLADIEWMLSKAAGYDAGFALVAGVDSLSGNGQASGILDTVREWETARLDGAFTAGQRERLRDANGEWRLRRADDDGLELTPVTFSPTHTYEAVELQPGEPTEAEWNVENPYEAQPLRCVLRVVPEAGVASSSVTNPRLEVGFDEVVLPVTLAAHQYLVVDGGPVARVYDVNWNAVDEVSLDGPTPEFFPGGNPVRFVCGEAVGARVEVTFEMWGPPESVTA